MKNDSEIVEKFQEITEKFWKILQKFLVKYCRNFKKNFEKIKKF